jgi:hypothetical protein
MTVKAREPPPTICAPACDSENWHARGIIALVGHFERGLIGLLPNVCACLSYPDLFWKCASSALPRSSVPHRLSSNSVRVQLQAAAFQTIAKTTLVMAQRRQRNSDDSEPASGPSKPRTKRKRSRLGYAGRCLF